MVEFEVGFEFSDLQGLTEFSFKNRFYTYGIARLDKYGDRFDGQQFTDT